MAQVINKTVSLDIQKVEQNAFALTEAFVLHAQKEKWTSEEINSVLEVAMDGDFVLLKDTLTSHCKI